MSKLVLYYSSVSSNVSIKKHQQKIQMILSSKGYQFDLKDIAASEDDKAEMRRMSNDPKALPPQICNGDQYCGDFDAFEEAVESETLAEFLKV